MPGRCVGSAWPYCALAAQNQVGKELLMMATVLRSGPSERRLGEEGREVRH